MPSPSQVLQRPPGTLKEKCPGRQRQSLGLGLRRKQFADQIEALDVGNGIRARRPSDRRLINQHDIIQPFDAGQRLEHRAGIAAIGLSQRTRHGAIQHLVHERRLARPGHAGDGDQHAQRNLHVEAVQVVRLGSAQDQLFAARLASPGRHRNRNLA